MGTGRRKKEKESTVSLSLISQNGEDDDDDFGADLMSLVQKEGVKQVLEERLHIYKQCISFKNGSLLNLSVLVQQKYSKFLCTVQYITMLSVKTISFPTTFQTNEEKTDSYFLGGGGCCVKCMRGYLVGFQLMLGIFTQCLS